MRRRKTAEELESDAVARELASLCAPREKKPKTVSEKNIRRAIEEVEGMVETKDWSSARPAHLVALFCWAHLQCYEVDAVTTVRASYVQACGAAKRLLDDEFSGSYTEAVNFMRWLWMREADREDWRRQQKRDGGLLTWYRVFVDRRVVVEYRLAQRRGGVA